MGTAHDGASVVAGIQNGEVTHFKNILPHAVSMHCRFQNLSSAVWVRFWH